MHDKDKFSLSPENYGLLNSNGEWLIEPRIKKGHYEYAFDGQGFIELSNNKPQNNPRECSRFLVSKDTMLMQDQKLYKMTKSIGDYADTVISEFSFIQSVPGCGKTTFIKNYVIKNNGIPSDSNTGILVLFLTREGAKHFRSQIKNFKQVSDVLLRKNFRTTHSLLLSNEKLNYKEIVIDEALMIHAGEILLCARKVLCQSVKLIGDTQQILYINRLPQCDVFYFDPNLFSKCKEKLNISYRCTLSTALILSPFYDTGMLATSNVMNEMKRIMFKNLQSINFKPEKTVYLTFKQTEKDEITKHCKLNNVLVKVFTVHEYQGRKCCIDQDYTKKQGDL